MRCGVARSVLYDPVTSFRISKPRERRRLRNVHARAHHALKRPRPARKVRGPQFLETEGQRFILKPLPQFRLNHHSERVNHAEQTTPHASRCPLPSPRSVNREGLRPQAAKISLLECLARSTIAPGMAAPIRFGSHSCRTRSPPLDHASLILSTSATCPLSLRISVFRFATVGSSPSVRGIGRRTREARSIRPRAPRRFQPTAARQVAQPGGSIPSPWCFGINRILKMNHAMAGDARKCLLTGRPGKVQPIGHSLGKAHPETSWEETG